MCAVSSAAEATIGTANVTTAIAMKARSCFTTMLRDFLPFLKDLMPKNTEAARAMIGRAMSK
jgi:hypothetical protein